MNRKSHILFLVGVDADKIDSYFVLIGDGKIIQF
jgi:hypothetical protein